VSHEHGGVRAGARHQHALLITFALVVVFMVVEVAAGYLANSLALLSDAGHMLTDAVGLGMALAAITVGSRAMLTGHRTYGFYRLEILAALANAVLLVGVAVYVLYEAARRLQEPPDVLGTPMLLVALLGLLVNIVGFWLLRQGAGESLNIEGAFLEVLADLMGSIGVVFAAVILIVTGWPYADPLFGAGIGLFILPRAVRLGSKALRILVQAAPPDLDIAALRTELEDLPGVVDVHDLHVWTLTSEMEVASAHLMVGDAIDTHDVLDQARDVLRDRYHIAHATLQVEPDSHEGCAEVAW
jgi:cobalt-zinc-cadmium efflux system protein